MVKLRHPVSVLRAKPSGFTLVEVLVALAILSIALGAVLAAMGQAIDVTTTLRDRTLALWVAQERANDHLKKRSWPEVRTHEGTTEFAGREWQWREKVSSIRTTVSDPSKPPVTNVEMRRMDIEVMAPKSAYVLAKLTVFIGQP
jgi:general secretion pathway protein I